MSFAGKLYYRIIGEIGNLQQMAGNYGKARELCEKSALNGGDCVPALNLYGVVLLEDGKPDDALKYLKRAENLNKNKVAKKHITMSIASCYWLKGEIDAAILLLEQLTDEYDYINPNVYTTLGYLHMLKRNYDEAVKYTNMALAEDECHAPAYDNLGQIYLKQGDKEKAKENFKRAIELNSYMTDSKYYLGEIYEQEGYMEEAKELFVSAYGDKINALNTVSKAQLERKYESFLLETELRKDENS